MSPVFLPLQPEVEEENKSDGSDKGDLNEPMRLLLGPSYLEGLSSDDVHSDDGLNWRRRKCDVRRLIKKAWDPIVDVIFEALIKAAQSNMQLTEAAKKKRRRAYKNHVMMKVGQIRWTQVSVNNRFGNSLPIDWTIEMLQSGTVLPRELPLIRVAKFKGKYRSVDNRRLYCFKQAGITEVPVVVIKEDRKMKQLFEKNKTKNNGVDVRIIDVALNPKNLDAKVITYDPTGERPSQFWTVGQCIDMLAQRHETCEPEGEEDHEITEEMAAPLDAAQVNIATLDLGTVSKPPPVVEGSKSLVLGAPERL